MRARKNVSKFPCDAEFHIERQATSILIRPLVKEARSCDYLFSRNEAFIAAWDGRLDNRNELAEELEQSTACGEAEIVALAYERWGDECFAKFIGDFAVSISDAVRNCVILARDFVGVRQLYYSFDSDLWAWCTVLDPLTQIGEFPPDPCEQYFCEMLSGIPAAALTPFHRIFAVAPGSLVTIRQHGASTRRYWNFDPGLMTRYGSDAEYEEHFRFNLRRAVRRRLHSPSPTGAELSGGMDSSSIVSIADLLIAEGEAQTPRLFTISHYDNREPHWNEYPYFSLVEKKRGVRGHHIDLSRLSGHFEPSTLDDFCPLPGRDRFIEQLESALSECMQSEGSTVLLSGIGGDEFLGGVPNPVPELQDLIVNFRWHEFMARSSEWGKKLRQPWIALSLQSAEELLPQSVRRLYRKPLVPPWVGAHARQRLASNREVEKSKPSFLGFRPSFQANLNTLDCLTKQMSCYAPSRHTNFNYSYPYLDRDFLQFLFSLPREELMRPGQRRSLMRRSLAEILPKELLERRRKAYVIRAPLKTLEQVRGEVRRCLRNAMLGQLGLIEVPAFERAMDEVLRGDLTWLGALTKTIKLEQWLNQYARFFSAGYSSPERDCESKTETAPSHKNPDCSEPVETQSERR